MTSTCVYADKRVGAAIALAATVLWLLLSTVIVRVVSLTAVVVEGVRIV
jgi:hypothetical protein